MAAGDDDRRVTRAPTFSDIFTVMSAASVGDATARVTVPEAPPLDDTATRFAIALNLLLDDLALQAAEAKTRLDEKLKIEEQLRQAQKMEAIGRLAGGVAHDFNNLLSVILSYAVILLGELDSTDPMRVDLEEIKNAGQRAARLTRQLLAFSRQQPLEPRVLNLNDVIADMENMIRRLIGEDVELRALANADLWKIKADPGHIEQVIMNLVVNARDAMPRGGRLIIETQNVELDAAYALDHVGSVPGPHVMLVVSDTGIGMDKATQARIFEPFFTTKEKGKGTGLGLSTVFGIVKQSRGSIWVYSEPGRGTSFKIFLPRNEDAARPIPPMVQVATLRGSETVLLAEDEDQVRVVAREILQRSGYRVLEARSGEEALDIGETHEGAIDILLSDIVMPRMSGQDLARGLAPLRPAMKVLYMSGYTENAIVDSVVDEDVRFVQKPLTPESLLHKVREVLDTPVVTI